MTVRAGVLALALLPLAGALRAQAVARRDTLRIADLQDAAKRLDPRERQLALQRQATALRLRTIAADRLPALSGEGTAQYQSVVTTLPIRLPNVTVPGPLAFDHFVVSVPLGKPSSKAVPFKVAEFGSLMV